MMKKCSKCKQIQPLNNFHLSKKGGQNRDSRCKTCRSIIAKEYRQKDGIRERISNQHLKRKYGITFEEKEKMYYEQKEKCKICSNKIILSSSHVDHDHKTGEIRGLLCGNCNKVLGLAKDNPFIFSKAIGYLISNGAIEKERGRFVYSY